MLTDPLFLFALVACVVVAAILLTGISTFGRGGSDNAKRSNTLMRWRIYAQALAIVAILVFVYFRRVGG